MRWALGGDWEIQPRSDLAVLVGGTSFTRCAKAVSADELDFYARRSYRVPYCEYVVAGLPHLVVLASDGALIVVRLDLLDMVACDYHLDYDSGRSYQLSAVGDTLYVVSAPGGGKSADSGDKVVEDSGESKEWTDLWAFELPSLVFRRRRRVDGRAVLAGSGLLYAAPEGIRLEELADEAKRE